MQLRHIEITNFRPYRGAEVDLTDTDNHIHVIEGPQGAGKTSFHRAVQWGLYGGKGPTTNYKTNWNETARENNDEEMEVRIKFEKDGRDHILERDIGRFTHSQKEAHEKLVLIIDGDTRREGEEAQDYIRELLPEQLKEFFFLDGEMIQDLIDDETGVEVKEDIETILKHEAIINAREDLQTVIKERYKTERDRIEGEREERSELEEEISELRNEKREKVERKKEISDERKEVAEDIEETKQELEDYNEELVDRLEQFDEDIRELERKKREAVQKMQDAWENMYVGILVKDLEDTRDDLQDRIGHLEELRSTVQKQDVVKALQKKAKDGTCPICGSEDHDGVRDITFKDDVGASETELSREISECQRKLRKLDRASEPEVSPVAAANRAQELRQRIRDKKDKKDELMAEYGGRPEEGQKEHLEDMLQSLEQRQEDLDDEWDDLREEISELEDKIEQKRKEKQRKDGEQAYREIRAKIKAAEQAIDHLDTIRHEHIQKQRGEIKEEMNIVFDQVSRSEFIKGRYKGIDFRGEPGDDDSFVLELIKQNGDRKAMTDRPPSAGEAQLTALSFIFGLNKMAKYSTTIVFDTVAGRLDLENSKAQGDFFTTLNEDIILLVTDAELEKLRPAIEADIGKHYRIRPDSQMNSHLEEK